MPDYFDHNASTPVASSVIDVMANTMRTHFANASSTDHIAGSKAANVISEARELISGELGVRAADVIFTSGATEANGLAIRGTFQDQLNKGRNQIISAATEHPSVLNTLQSLGQQGADVVILPVDEHGLIDLLELTDSLTERTALVTIMAANNETGVLQPLSEIGKICEANGTLFHSDLTQMVGYLPLDLSALGLHLGSLSAHKMYGPKGVGALFARSRRPRARLVAQQTGGGQEKGLRSGTLNTEGIAGFGEAFRVRRDRLVRSQEIKVLRDRLQGRMLSISGTRMNGHPEYRLPNTLNLSVEGVDPHALQHALKDKVLFSTSSACSTEKVETSSVLSAMFGDSARARSGFRIGLGFGTTEVQVDHAAAAFERAIAQLRLGILGWDRHSA